MYIDWNRVGAGALAMFAVSLGLVSAAQAQSYAGDDTPGRASGAPTVQGRGFHIGASFKTLYDGNILRLGDGVPLRANRTKADFRFTPSVNAGYSLPVGRQQLFIEADLGRDFYARNGDLNRTRYGINGGAIWHLGRSCSGAITADYRRRQSLLSEASVQTDNTQQLQAYAATADCAPPVGIGFGGSVARNVTDNDNPARQVQDSRTMIYDAHLNFGAPGLGNFSAGGVLSRFSYPRRTLFVESSAGVATPIGDKLDSYQARLGYSRSVGARFTVSGSVSYIRAKPKPSDVLSFIQLFPGGPLVGFPTARQSYSGPGYSLAVDYHPGVRLGASLSASRNISSSSNVGARFDIRDSIGAEVNYKFGPAITTALGGTYDHRQYKGGFATVEEPLARVSDSISRIYARASYSPRDLYGVDFEIAHQNRSSNPSIYNFSSTSASVTLRVKFGRG